MTDVPTSVTVNSRSRPGPADLERPGRLNRLHRHKHSFFLGTLAGLLLLSPMLDDEGAGSLLLSGLFSLVLVVGTLSVSRVRRDLLIVLALSLCWLYLTWLHPAWSASLLDRASGFVLAACTLYMAAVLLLAVVRAEAVTHDVISGAVAVYLLMGIAWAVIYLLIEGLEPGSFALGGPDHGTVWGQLLYFSFTTLTTLGYGDIAPVSPVARVWAVFEAVFGTLFLAVLVSRLVGLYRD